MAEVIAWTLGLLPEDDRAAFVDFVSEAGVRELTDEQARVFVRAGLLMVRDRELMVPDTVRVLLGSSPAGPADPDADTPARRLSDKPSGDPQTQDARAESFEPGAKAVAGAGQATSEVVRALILRVADMEASLQAGAEASETSVDHERLRRQLDIAVDELTTALGLRSGRPR